MAYPDGFRGTLPGGPYAPSLKNEAAAAVDCLAGIDGTRGDISVLIDKLQARDDDSHTAAMAAELAEIEHMMEAVWLRLKKAVENH